jgi:hypothetical protein
MLKRQPFIIPVNGENRLSWHGFNPCGSRVPWMGVPIRTTRAQRSSSSNIDRFAHAALVKTLPARERVSERVKNPCHWRRMERCVNGRDEQNQYDEAFEELIQRSLEIREAIGRWQTYGPTSCKT